MPKIQLSLLIASILVFNHGAIAAPISQPIETLEQGEHTALEQARFYYAKGLDYLNSHKLLNAKIAFEKSLSFEPKDSKTLLSLAETLFKLDDIEAATIHVETAASIAPNDPHVLTSLARVRLLQGKFKESENSLLKAIAVEPKLFAAQIDLADLYSIHFKDFKQAAIYYTNATTLDPKHAGSHYGLGISNKQLNKIDAAIKSLKKSAELDPKVPLPHQALAEIYLSENQPKQAQKQFQIAKQIDPGYSAAYFSLADFYMGQGDTKQALHEIDTLIEHSPAMAEAYLRRGVIYNSINDTANAKADYQQAIDKGTNNPITFNNLAWLLATNEQNYSKALDLSNKANQIAPNNAGFLDTLGWIQHLKGDQTRAKQTLELATRFSPTNPEILYHLAVVQQQLGMEDAAESLLKKALKNNPDNKLSAEIRKALGR